MRTKTVFRIKILIRIFSETMGEAGGKNKTKTAARDQMIKFPCKSV